MRKLLQLPEKAGLRSIRRHMRLMVDYINRSRVIDFRGGRINETANGVQLSSFPGDVVEGTSEGGETPTDTSTFPWKTTVADGVITVLGGTINSGSPSAIVLGAITGSFTGESTGVKLSFTWGAGTLPTGATLEIGTAGTGELLVASISVSGDVMQYIKNPLGVVKLSEEAWGTAMTAWPAG